MHDLALLSWNLGTVLLHRLVVGQVGILAQSRSELALGLVLRRGFLVVVLVVYVQSFYFPTVWLLSVLEVSLLLRQKLVVARRAQSGRLMHHAHVALHNVD